MITPEAKSARSCQGYARHRETVRFVFAGTDAIIVRLVLVQIVAVRAFGDSTIV